MVRCLQDVRLRCLHRYVCTPYGTTLHGVWV